MPKEIDWTSKRQAWVRLINDLCRTIKRWADNQGWSVSEEQKTIEEEHMGRYTVPSLTIQTPSARIYIDPVGRNIIGAEGRVDIFSFPTLNRMLLVRISGKWRLKTESRIDWPKAWGEKAFAELVRNLGAAA